MFNMNMKQHESTICTNMFTNQLRANNSNSKQYCYKSNSFATHLQMCPNSISFNLKLQSHLTSDVSTFEIIQRQLVQLQMCPTSNVSNVRCPIPKSSNCRYIKFLTYPRSVASKFKVIKLKGGLISQLSDANCFQLKSYPAADVSKLV